jgi:molecular chaperone GrpE
MSLCVPFLLFEMIQYKTIQERMNTQSKKGNTMATVQVARNMLKAMDGLNRAFGAIKPSNAEEEAIEAEYKEAYNQILTTFEGLGIEVIETVGKEFDYEVHQAVMQKPSPDYEEGIVCEELQKGFKIGDTLIRASMVVVAA